MRWLIALSAIILAAGMAVHVSTFTAFDAATRLPYLWVFFPLIFVVFIPAVLLQPRQPPGEGKKKRSANELLAGAPRLLVVLAATLFVYTIANFAIYMIRYQGQPQDTANGGYELREHGKLVRTLNEAEFHTAKARQLRAFSGHWMAFTAVALTMHVGTLKRRRRSAEAIAAAHFPQAAFRGGISISLHAAVRLIATAIGFFGGFLVVVLPATMLASEAICVAFPVGIVCAFVGIGIGQWVVDRRPARCPRCGGRAFFREDRRPGGKGSWEYVCADCAGLFDTAGAIAADMPADAAFRTGATMPPPVEPDATDC